MQPFKTHTGIAVPLLGDDINTDQIAPVQAMRSLKPDYKALLFMRARRRDDGSEECLLVCILCVQRPLGDPGRTRNGFHIRSSPAAACK